MIARVFLGGLFGCALALSPVQGQDFDNELYVIGLGACAAALDGQVEGIDGASFASTIAEAGVSKGDYCHCVATEFTIGDPGDLALLNADTMESVDHFQFMTVMNMMICVPDMETDWEVTDGDLVDIDMFDEDATEDLPDEDFAYDEGDVYMCQQALDGGIMVPGFNEIDVLERLRSGGQSRTQLCTCAARYFAAGGEGLQDGIESAANPTIAYASTMAGAIEMCL
ncbi:hypothetical protein [Devosia sp.]|uniref:hypothetical protein n=1 Tax=Devosia sp. TaxID=1871048 RepID=UPI001AC55665|nr:hypothetical protein [Devosia sp.]MBN9334890.1 hypothetical protein [Devosia sp.]